MTDLKPTPSYKVIHKLLNNYNKDALNLKHSGLVDLLDAGRCIRLAPDIITGRKWLLMYLKFLDVYDREKARGTMR
jgi:hypothetical protein